MTSQDLSPATQGVMPMHTALLVPDTLTMYKFGILYRVFNIFTTAMENRAQVFPKFWMPKAAAPPALPQGRP